MKFVFNAIFFTGFYFQSLAQLPSFQAGVPVNYTFANYPLNIPVNCSPTYHFQISIDSFAIPLVTGVDWKAIVDFLTIPSGAFYTSETGIVQLNDTLTFSPLNTDYNFYSDSVGIANLKLILLGTPSVPFEIYPCQFFFVSFTSPCENSEFIIADTFTTCSVGNFSSVNEWSNDNRISVQFNDSKKTIHIHIKTDSVIPYSFSLYNLSGQTFLHKTIFNNNVEFSLPKISAGLFFWRIQSKTFTANGKLFTSNH